MSWALPALVSQSSHHFPGTVPALEVGPRLQTAEAQAGGGGGVSAPLAQLPLWPPSTPAQMLLQPQKPLVRQPHGATSVPSRDAVLASDASTGQGALSPPQVRQGQVVSPLPPPQAGSSGRIPTAREVLVGQGETKQACGSVACSEFGEGEVGPEERAQGQPHPGILPPDHRLLPLKDSR